MKASMFEWMSQYTFTSPGFGKFSVRELPRGYVPRPKRRGGDRLKTLWKIGSMFGTSMFDFTATAITRGTNIWSFCASRGAAAEAAARASADSAAAGT